MEKRVELNWLLDFYGPLLTENRQRVLRMYCEEDLSLQEIAEQENISRQGVYDAVRHAQAQLMDFEEKLGMLSRYRRIQAGVEVCRGHLNDIAPTAGSEEALTAAKRALEDIEWIEVMDDGV